MIVVGHSMGGIVLNRVGELASGRIDALVYLAAHMPRAGAAAGPYFGGPENATSLVNPVLVGDPLVTGAFRVDLIRMDGAYQAALKFAFYNDATDADVSAAVNLLTPDMPVGPMVVPIELSAAVGDRCRGTTLRRCATTHCRRALQQRFIDEADAFTPGNLTRVQQMDSGHSPFITRPAELAWVLGRISLGWGCEDVRQGAALSRGRLLLAGSSHG